MAINIRQEDALNYHRQGQPGKIEVVPTKLLSSQLDLALAYSPGVAEPCKEIAANPDDVYKYTAKGNLVGVITNGTARMTASSASSAEIIPKKVIGRSERNSMMIVLRIRQPSR